MKQNSYLIWYAYKGWRFSADTEKRAFQTARSLSRQYPYAFAVFRLGERGRLLIATYVNGNQGGQYGLARYSRIRQGRARYRQ